MSKTLNFDTGLVEYDVNGTAKIRFNPSDANFIDRFRQTVAELDKRQDAMQADVDAAGDDPTKMFGLLSARDAEMRQDIDGLFGDGTADAVFPGINCYAMADGLPVWMNFMFAVAQEITDGLNEEQKRTDPRVKAMNKKYDGMMRKYKGIKAKAAR